MKITKKLIGGNWKMNADLNNVNEVAKYKEVITEQIDIFIAVPYVYLRDCSKVFPENINLAAQDLSCHEKGPFTGEISARNLKDFEVKYVLVGHSERRANHRESNSAINEKIKISIKNEIRPVLCIGESEEVRREGNYLDFLYLQFKESSKDLKNVSFDIAYEPIWAIGSGKAATASQITEIIIKIKQWMKESFIEGRCIYGGSVSNKNIEKLKQIDCLDGFLIGDSSLDSRFIEIIEKYMLKDL